MKYSQALMRHTFPRSRRWSRLHVGAARIAIAIAEIFAMGQSPSGIQLSMLGMLWPLSATRLPR